MNEPNQKLRSGNKTRVEAATGFYSRVKIRIQILIFLLNLDKHLFVELKHEKGQTQHTFGITACKAWVCGAIKWKKGDLQAERSAYSGRFSEVMLITDEGTHSETVHCFITRPHLADVMRCGGFYPILDPKSL